MPADPHRRLIDGIRQRLREPVAVVDDPWTLAHADTCAANIAQWPEPYPGHNSQPCTCGLDALRDATPPRTTP